jgi:membrane protease YdiL (CAAX protease family)
MGLTLASWPWFIAYFSLINPFVEEYFWRGVLGNDMLNLYIGDVVFAGYHSMILWGRVRPIFILFAVMILVSAGWLWRQISREDGGLLAASLGHMAADFTILTTIYWISAL